MSGYTYPLAGAIIIGFSLGCLLPSAMAHVDAWLDRETRKLAEDAMAALVDTDLEPAHKPLSRVEADARRIREQMAENQREAAVREFRESLDAWGGEAS